MAVFTWTIPVVVTAAGLTPQAPLNLYDQLQQMAASAAPGYTGRLPGSLIEDVSSTAVAAISLCDQAKVELVNSLTPFGANLFVLNQLAQCYGVTPIGSIGNTLVYITWTGTAANVGLVIPAGTTITTAGVSFQTQLDAIIPSAPYITGNIPALALTNSTTPIPASSTWSTQYTPPSGSLTINNASAGTQSLAETYYAFRLRVMQAGLAASTSTGRFIKTAVQGQPSVPIISVQPPVSGGGFRVVVGGSYNPYQTALNIYNSIADPTRLLGSAVNTARNVTISVIDYPDTWPILFVAAVSQVVTITITWNTTLTSFASGAAFPQLVAPPTAAYVSGLGINQPINSLALQEIFLETVDNLIDPAYISKLQFVVNINGSPVSPTGTDYIGDTEGYFLCATTGITVVQG